MFVRLSVWAMAESLVLLQGLDKVESFRRLGSFLISLLLLR